MSRKEELLAAIKSTQDPMLRRLYTAAYITKGLKDYNVNIVMVGGAAVEFYSAANYMTSDIDFIITATDGVKKVMTELGFVNNNAIWSIPDTDIVVEFPKGPLDGSWDKIKKIKTKYGDILVIGIEDIILDRASGIQFWHDSDEWVKFLMLSHYNDLDLEYLNKRARELMCDETIKEIQNWVVKQRNKNKGGI